MQNQTERGLTFKQAGKMVRIPFSEIRYLDAHQNHVVIHGKQEYTVARTLNEIKEQLDIRFHRVSEKIIINLGYFSRISKTEVHLKDGTILSLLEKDNAQPDLPPCPFCGGKAATDYAYFGHNYPGVHCTVCGAYVYDYDSLEKAINKWACRDGRGN